VARFAAGRLNLVTRLFPLGLVVALVLTATLGLSPLQPAKAASSAWGGYATQAKRPQFRPWNRAQRKPANQRWRPRAVSSEPRRTTYPTGASAATWSRAHRVRQPVFSSGLPDGRKPVRASRPQIPGVSFRPDRRVADAAKPAAATGVPSTGHTGYSAHKQFRPARSHRKASYEELHRGDATRAFMAARTRAYQMAHGLPVAELGARWRTW